MVQVLQGSDRRLADVALADICGRYWYPVYAYLRRSGWSAPDAEDLTQTTFQRLVTEEALRHVRQERGRLRSFLIGMIRQVISHHSRHHRAARRGGGVTILSLDEAGADQRYAGEPVDLLDPQRLYDRAWAQQLMETVRQKLHTSFVRTGRMEVWELVEPYLGWDDDPAPFAELGLRLHSSANAVRVLVHRLRKKFRELLEDEIGFTVSRQEDIPAELAWLRGVLR